MGSNETSRMDMKKNRRNEEEAKLKRQSLIRGVSLFAIAAVCVAVLGGKQVNKYLDKNGAWLTIGEHKVKKPEFEYYYQNSINTFMNTYGSYASYFGLDTSKPLDQQSYTDNLTWKDYFEQQAADTLQQVYALADTGKAEGFEHDAEKEVKKTISQIKDAAKANEQDPEDYVKSLYGEDATLDRVKEYMLLSEYASHYYEKVDKDTVVSEDEIKTRYEENKADYDSVDYMLCEIKADIPEETQAAETSAETETDAEEIVLDENETGDEEIVLEEVETGDEETGLEDESVSEAETGESVSETETETMSESEREELEKKKEEEKAKAMEEAKTKADAMLAAVSDADQFEALYTQYADETSSAAKHSGERSSSVSNSQVEEWLFDETRQAGDKTVIEDTEASAYYVVMYLNRFLDDTKTVDFRHILIKPEEVQAETSAETQAVETEESAEAETVEAGEEVSAETAETETVSESQSAAESEAQAQAADQAASEKAEKVYQEWKDGKATAKSFGKLAKKYSEDTGSNTNGGLYEKTAKGSMVSEVDSWLFDPSRKPGDTGIVHTTYGYHVMYFVGDNQPEWHNEAQDTIHDEKMESYMDDLEEKYPIKEGRKKLAYLHIPETETGTESETGSETDSAETESGAETAGEETAEETSQEKK